MKSFGHSIAYFISSHGFGHATRAAAVMSALRQADASIHFHIFTTAPEWIFEETMETGFSCHKQITDVGLVQKTPMHADLEATLDKLESFLPFNEKRIDSLARTLQKLECSLVLCDIAPLGIAVAKAAGLVSVLVENFTWDWIYAPYVERHPRFRRQIAYFEKWFDSADLRIQTMPVCRRRAGIVVNPVSRKSTMPRVLVRKRLGVSENRQLVVITMGGVSDGRHIWNASRSPGNVVFVMPGTSASFEVRGNQVRIPRRSSFFHPDLIQSADLVVGKAGYSTLAEVYHSGIPFGYIPRPSFRESSVLTRFIDEHMNGARIEPDDFYSGKWLDRLAHLLSASKKNPGVKNGAEQIAEFLLGAEKFGF